MKTPTIGAAITLALLATTAARAQDANPVEQAAPAAKPLATATSPDKSIAVAIFIDGDGRPTYSVTRKGKAILGESRLGMAFTDAPKIERNIELIGKSTSSSDTSWTQPYGEWKTIRDNHTEFTVRFREKTGLKREMQVIFRIFDDGIGFRYFFPDQPNLHHANIADELTQFAFAQDGTAWWKPAYGWNREEYLYQKTPLDHVGVAQTVFTAKLADGTHAAVHEAALVDYSAMNLMRLEGNTLISSLTPGAGAPKVSRDAPFASPWRTVILADDAPGLYMSHIELNLNEPNKLGDVSWVKPGKFVGVWWNMIRGEWTWATGPKHGATTANVKKYIDFAAANGIPGVLVEGWNIGWDGDWFGNGNAMQFDQPTPDFDAAELSRYAKSMGVHLIGHNETGGSASHYDG